MTPTENILKSAAITQTHFLSVHLESHIIHHGTKQWHILSSFAVGKSEQQEELCL